MSTAAKFSNNVEISGNVDISGNINLDGTLTVDGSFSLYGYHIPDPSGEYNKVLTISGDGYSWETVQSGSAGDEEINAAEQTFYEIITEQPRAFTAETMTSGALFDNTVSSIDIAWNFDNLIPKDENGQQQILNITENLNQRVLPCITDIYFEISSNEAPDTLIATKSISVTSSHNYDIDSNATNQIEFSKNSTTMKYILTYKTLNLSISIQDTNSYTVSIYGQNSSNGSDVNKLTYTGLVFQATGIPKVPTITSIEDSTSNNTISFTINATTTDMDVDTDDTVLSSALYISQLDLSHTLIDSKRSGSTGYGIPSHSASDISASRTDAQNTGGNSTDSSGNQPVSISPTYSSANGNFYLGSKYTMQARIYNLLNSNPTDYSDSVETDYSDIPDKEDLNTSSPFNTTPFTYNNKTEDGGDDQFEINQAYSNIMIYDYSRTSTQSVTFNTSNPSQIEVSDPDTNIDNSFGYGKYIDNSLNLITLECWLNDNGTDISLHTIHFHGWNHQDVSHTYYYQNSSGNNIDFFTIAESPYSDVFSGTTHQEGFRLKVEVSSATILLEDMSYNNLMVPFDPYRDESGNSTGYIRDSNSNADTSYNNGYTFNYRYTHNNSHSTNYSQEIKSEQLYIDYFPDYDYSLTSSNGTSDWTYTVEVTSVGYIMGIPYVYEFDLSINRDHYNAHSQYRYHRDDGQLANLNYLYASASNVSTLGSALDNGNYTYLSLPTNIDDFNDNGTYNGGRSWTGLSYVTQTGASATNNTITGFQTSTAVYNLYDSHGWFTNNISFADDGNKNHYFDYDSLNNSSVFSTNNIYELSYNTISDLSSNFYSVHTSLDVYDNSNHEKEIQAYTLPFINGSFTVDDSTYPDICGSFEWNGNIDGYNNSVYINKNYGIDLDGNSGDYKWIVYDVDLTEPSQYYNSSSSSYSSDVQGTGGEGINVTTIMNLLFDSNMISKFSFDSNTNVLTNDNTYIFIVGYRNDTDKAGYYLGTMSKTFQASSSTTWYSNSNVGQTSLSSILGKTDDRAGVSQSSSVTAISNMIGDSYNSWDDDNDIIIQSLGSSAFTEYKLYFGIKMT